MGAQMVKEVASKTSDVAGDGTTTATLLAQSIVHEGLRVVAAGANPLAVKKGIDMAVIETVKNIRAMSTACDGSREAWAIGGQQGASVVSMTTSCFGMPLG